MPEMSCLFGVASSELLAALRADPDCDERLHRFTKCEGLTLSGDGLAVVRLGGKLEPLWGPVPERWQAGPPVDGPLKNALPHHPFLLEALPPPDVAARFAGIARDTGRRLCWWWWWERGDDLYADAAWCFGPDRRFIAARETVLAGGESFEGRVRLYEDGSPDGIGVKRAPLQLVMQALGFRSSLQYFAPMDDFHFDWSPHRT